MTFRFCRVPHLPPFPQLLALEAAVTQAASSKRAGKRGIKRGRSGKASLLEMASKKAPRRSTKVDKRTAKLEEKAALYDALAAGTTTAEEGSEVLIDFERKRSEGGDHAVGGGEVEVTDEFGRVHRVEPGSKQHKALCKGAMLAGVRRLELKATPAPAAVQGATAADRAGAGLGSTGSVRGTASATAVHGGVKAQWEYTLSSRSERHTRGREARQYAAVPPPEDGGGLGLPRPPDH